VHVKAPSTKTLTNSSGLPPQHPSTSSSARAPVIVSVTEKGSVSSRHWAAASQEARKQIAVASARILIVAPPSSSSSFGEDGAVRETYQRLPEVT
jgi:hypothetical protein